METQTTLTEAERNISDLLKRVVECGETVLLTRDGQVVGRITPDEPRKVLAGNEFAETWARRPRLTPEEAEQLAVDVEEARRLWNRPPQDPWKKWD